MAGLLCSDAQGPIGLPEGKLEWCYATMRGGTGVKGQWVYFDIPAGDTGTTASTNFGLTTSPTANVLLATATHNGVGTAGWITGILLEDAADDAKVRVAYRGKVQAAGGDTTAVGLKVAPNSSSYSALIITKGGAPGLMLETNAASGALKWILLDGTNWGAYTA